jgi:hypothetical protein
MSASLAQRFSFKPFLRVPVIFPFIIVRSKLVQASINPRYIGTTDK